MVLVGDVILSKIIEEFVHIGFKYAAGQYFAWDTRSRMKEELERLNKARPHIQAVVEMTGKQEIKGALNEWLWQLKDALDEAENVLDELDYLKLEKQVVEKASEHEKASGSNEHGYSGRGKVLDVLSESTRKVCEALKPDPTLERLRGAVKRLDEVAAGVGDFISTLQLQESTQLHQQHQSQSTVSTRETGPDPTEEKVFGRDEEREKLLGWLGEDDSITSVSLYSIIGLGGLGKTTLAQLVYNDESLANYSFKCKIWVCISTPFDVKKITTDMIEYATKERAKVSGLSALQKTLKDLVSSSKFLIVLDDTWNDDNRFEWDKLFAPLRNGHKGSKILLTTRNERVAEMAASALGGSINERMKLRTLDEDNFLSLFKQHAFAGVDSHEYRKLEFIGKKIAKRLGGLPLAAKMIGAQLNTELDDNYWNEILHADNISNVTSVLMLSYNHLPMHLRLCFAYCSIFPQDYWFKKDDLVFMWMALGLVTLEDTGRRYFDDLVKRSFLEQRYDYNEVGYNMHDLLHDLAREVSHGECFRFVGDMSIDQIPNTVRHLHFETDKLDLLKDVGKLKNLRTLVLVFGGYVNEHNAKAFEEAFKSLESIRVLRLDVYGMNVLPEAIGNMRHIRYLSIRHWISRLPNSFCRLYHLQVLAFEYFDTETVLGLNNLISLRHLIPWEVYYEEIEGLGTLTSLQRLSFAANVYKLSELKEMRDLRELKIRGLENRKHHEEVSTIELHRKRNLLRLELVWSDDSDVADEYEQMLDRLQPPDGLRELTIEGYQGARSPCWMDPDLLINLEYVRLRCGSVWKHLPSLGKLPYLTHLELSSLPALRQINCEGGFQQLKYLSIYDCEQWEEWCVLEAEAVPWCPLLKELVIRKCPRLKALPPLPLGLQSLELEDVDCLIPQRSGWAATVVLEYMSLGYGRAWKHLPSLGKLPYLTRLTLWGLPALQQINCQGGFQQLKQLSIYDCEQWEEWCGLEAEAVPWCPLLKELVIRNCPRLKALPPLPLGLRKLELEDVGSSDSPTFWVGSNCGGSSCGTSFSSTSSPSLSELSIRRCGKLTSVAGLFRHHLMSLRELWIVNCPELRMSPNTVTPVDCFALPSLRSLNLVDCGGSDGLTPTLLQLMQSSLTSLELSGANHITAFPSEGEFTLLRGLHLAGCGELASIEGLKSLPHLKYLTIWQCPKLVQAAAETTPASIKREEEQEFTSTVEHLYIDDPFLLRIEPLRKLTSVRWLNIGDCSHLEAALAESWLLQNSTSLQHLNLWGKAKILPSSLQTLSSLEDLRLANACELQSLPQLPLSLKWLQILGCSEALKERCRENEGADWPNIQHIPEIEID